MKKLLFFTSIIAVCAIYTVNAQEYEYVPFPTENAIWSTFEKFPSNPQPYDKMNIIYALFDEDSIIGNKVCQKLFKVYDTIPSREGAYLRYLMYEDNKRIFINDLLFEEDSILLYDYNLHVGDKFEMGLPPHSLLEVAEIDTIILANKKRKRFWFTNSEILDDLYWIEGIGSTNGLLHPGVFVVGTHNTLLCFKNNCETIYYNNMFGTCYPDYPIHYNSIISKEKTKQLNMYPNPASDKVTIEFDKKATGIINIYSIEGRLINNNAISNSNKHEINLNDIKKGIYIIYFKNTRTNKLHHNRLIIN